MMRWAERIGRTISDGGYRSLLDNNGKVAATNFGVATYMVADAVGGEKVTHRQR